MRSASKPAGTAQINDVFVDDRGIVRDVDRQEDLAPPTE